MTWKEFKDEVNKTIRDEDEILWIDVSGEIENIDIVIDIDGKRSVEIS